MKIRELLQKYKSKELSPKEYLNDLTGRVEKENSTLNSFLYLNRETNDVTFNNASLSGIPIAVKDNILTKGYPTTAGSEMLKGYVPPYNASVIEKLLKAGYFLVGKTNMDEFAMGSSTENSAYGVTKNPLDTSRVPGGSSGGSAAAVSAGFVLGALGTDTGGSIRQPAGFCGVVGFCPSYGAVSRYGVIAMSSSLDQVGTLAPNVEDARYLFDIIKGKDRLDATSFNINNKEHDLPSKCVVGIPSNTFAYLSPEVKEIFEGVVQSLERGGVKIEYIPSVDFDDALAVYYIIAPAEISSNLARYDGVRYGKKAAGDNFIEYYSKTRSMYLGEEVKRRIMIGTFVLSAGHYEEYYGKANLMRVKVREFFDESFKKVDFIITPTSPTTAFKFGERQTPLEMYKADIFTIPSKLAGLPAISIPSKREGKKAVGIQIIGGRKEDYKVLGFAERIEEII